MSIVSVSTPGERAGLLQVKRKRKSAPNPHEVSVSKHEVPCCATSDDATRYNQTFMYLVAFQDDNYLANYKVRNAITQSKAVV